MMFRGALVRLAAQYFLLLVLILGCFDFIVYFTVSQALADRIHSDSLHSVALAEHDLTVTGDTITANMQSMADPSFADTFVRVQTTAKQVVLPAPANIVAAFSRPVLHRPILAARNGRANETQASASKQQFGVGPQ